LRRVEEQFAGVNGEGVKSLLQNFSSLNDPLPFVKCFFDAYPLAAEQLLAAEDTVYFLAISQRPGQKPVPFIPVLDASFEVWFKKVSSDMRRFHLSTDVNDLRIPCGLQKISRPSLTKILSVFVSFKVP
jgi:enoyl reductase-like protein